MALEANSGVAAAKRVSVMVGSRSVPLLASRPEVDGARSPWNGLIVEKHRVGAIEVPEHEHPTFCLHLQTSGPVAMDWRSFGKTGHVRSGAGSLIMIAPGTRDSLLWHGPSQRIVASVEPALLTQAAEQIGVRGKWDFENRWTFEDEQLRLLLTEMEREMSAGWAMGSLYGDLLGMSLSIALIRKYGNIAAAPALMKGGLSRPALRDVLGYVEANLERDIRLEELAAVAGLSTFHFARSFRVSVGVTPHQYISNLRVERAKDLLMKPEWSVQQVASAVGFVSASHFAKVFRGVMGVSPTEWRLDRS
jgi:AraC family transcriptional regulator